MEKPLQFVSMGFGGEVETFYASVELEMVDFLIFFSVHVGTLG